MRCDEGYICEVCGEEVEGVTESDLYLRYVMGRLDVEALPHHPERHLRCNPVQAQFIVDERFPPVEVEGPFSKSEMPDAEREQEEQRTTQAWQRLQEIPSLNLAVEEYPLANTGD